ncbi:MAG: S1/P1 nuclease [Alistipes sp.]|nr:S1/P1 nuclease [Candidatus Alistipes equi]
MKKTFILLLLLLPAVAVFGWGKLGHTTAIALAERHLTERTKENIAKFFQHDIIKDAVWMDHHRHDKEIAYTSHWHGCYVDKDFNFDPNPTLAEGCVVRSFSVVEENLSKWRELTDSAVVMNVRMLIHFAADVHCPTHNHFHYRKPRYVCYLNGTKIPKFHSVYDKMPNYVFPKMNAREVAKLIDTKNSKEIKKITNGNWLDWIKETAKDNYSIYSINPFGQTELANDTVERSRELIIRDLQRSGYRLAYMLNKYFDN